MARLPTPGSDEGKWGDILNEYLSVEHNADGTLKLSDTIAAKYTKPGSGIPKTDFTSTVQASLDKADASASATDLSTHATDTTSIHGIASTANLMTKGELVLNVKDYGAVGNGTTDDTAAIQAAIDAASAAGGGMVFVPVGTYIVTTLTLKSKVMLVGVGWKSMLKLKASTGVDMITLADTSVQWTVLRDLRLTGNKANQTVASRGIYYDNAGGAFDFNDSTHLLVNVLVDNFKGDGITLSTNCREARLNVVQVRDCDGNGYSLTGTDNFLVSCTAGNNGLAGFNVLGASNHLTSCKAFYSGQAMANSADKGDGFYINNARIYLVACEAQDNWRHGFMFDGATNCLAEGCVADSNGKSSLMTGAGAGFLLQNSVRTRVTGQSFDRNTPAIQGYGVRFGSPASTNCTVDLFIDNIATSVVQGSTINGAGQAGHAVTVNALQGSQVRTYTASLTPDFTTGGTIFVTLTGNITINEPGRKWGGMRVSFVLTQDATGGRTTTFVAAYKASWTPDTSPNKINTISFIYDGTNWIQQSVSTGM